MSEKPKTDDQSQETAALEEAETAQSAASGENDGDATQENRPRPDGYADAIRLAALNRLRELLR